MHIGVSVHLILFLRIIIANIYPFIIVFKGFLHYQAFVQNKQVDSNVRMEYTETEWISFDEENGIDLRSSKVLSPKRVQFAFKEYLEQRFIKLKSIPFSIKDPEWGSIVDSGFKRSGYRQLECNKS